MKIRKPIIAALLLLVLSMQAYSFFKKAPELAATFFTKSADGRVGLVVTNVGTTDIIQIKATLIYSQKNYSALVADSLNPGKSAFLSISDFPGPTDKKGPPDKPII
jgi:hypothetical protein